MDRRTGTPPPRAHWLVLIVILVLVVVGLGVDALLLRRVGESGEERDHQPTAGQVPPGVADGGPVIDARSGRPRSIRVPDKTVVLTFDDGPDPMWMLWSLPLQQLVYRQLMYLVLVQSVVTAVAGARLPWHKLHRAGHAAADAPVAVR